MLLSLLTIQIRDFTLVVTRTSDRISCGYSMKGKFHAVGTFGIWSRRSVSYFWMTTFRSFGRLIVIEFPSKIYVGTTILKVGIPCRPAFSGLANKMKLMRLGNRPEVSAAGLLESSNTSKTTSIH